MRGHGGDLEKGMKFVVDDVLRLLK